MFISRFTSCGYRDFPQHVDGCVWPGCPSSHDLLCTQTCVCAPSNIQDMLWAQHGSLWFARLSGLCKLRLISIFALSPNHCPFSFHWIGFRTWEKMLQLFCGTKLYSNVLLRIDALLKQQWHQFQWTSNLLLSTLLFSVISPALVRGSQNVYTTFWHESLVT